MGSGPFPQSALERFRTRAEQERALEILQFKLDVLWKMLDAIHQAYVEEG